MPYEEWLKTKKCHSCGAMGHLKKDCRKVKQEGCFNCGGKDHLVADCPYARDIRCYKCDSKEHRTGQCSKVTAGEKQYTSKQWHEIAFKRRRDTNKMPPKKPDQRQAQVLVLSENSAKRLQMMPKMLEVKKWLQQVDETSATIDSSLVDVE